jgi:geranylgeranyl diphosphate synthase type II
MESTSAIEQALEVAVASCDTLGCPPRLAAAIRYAVFPGGARIRPRLCLAIAAGCGEPQSPLAEATAASIELLHCASLVHDDLPCFDNAALRRNRPSVHRAFDERIALLVGDALIVLAFQNVARAFAGAAPRLPGIVLALGRAAGARGIQAFEDRRTVRRCDGRWRAVRRRRSGALANARRPIG